MNAPSRLPPHGPAPAQQRTTPRPATSGRENSGLMYFFIGAAVLALLIVVGFNLLGPDGASRTGVGDGPAQSHSGPTTGGPSPETNTNTGTGVGMTPGQARRASGSAIEAVPTPQAADTPTPPGRESVGAPAGAAPQVEQTQPAAPPTANPASR